MKSDKEEKGKKISILYILKILKEFSDEKHPLSQKQIIELLDSKYGQSINRKSVKRDLEKLKEAGFPVTSREVSREVKGRNNALTLDWQWNHLLSEEEESLLLDTLYFSHMKQSMVKNLAEKVRRLGSFRFSDDRTCIRNLPFGDSVIRRNDIRDLLKILTEAIKGKKKIQFQYMHYEVDLKSHANTDKDGKIIQYMASPYIIFAGDERYSLLCYVEGRKEAEILPVERMSGLTVTDQAIAPMKSVPNAEKYRTMKYVKPIAPAKIHMAEVCRLRVDNTLITELLEQFGKGVTICSALPTEVEVEVTAPPDYVECWAFCHAPHVRVTAPESLVKHIRDKLSSLQRMYQR